MPSDMKQIRVPLPPQQAAELALAARQHNISTAELIRRLLVSEAIISDPQIQHGGKR